MRKHAPITLAMACTALLLTQMLGLHLHVEGADQPGGAHMVHLQHQAHGDHDHDHGGEVDGSKLELGNVWSKLLPLFLLSVVFALRVTPRADTRPLAAVPARLQRTPLRWRPPLRAPPTLS